MSVHFNRAVIDHRLADKAELSWEPNRRKSYEINTISSQKYSPIKTYLKSHRRVLIQRIGLISSLYAIFILIVDCATLEIKRWN